LTPVRTITSQNLLLLQNLPRIRAVLRRGSRPARAILQIGDPEVDRVSHTVRRGSPNIDLSPKEFALLEFLMRHEGQPVSRTAIVEQVWKFNFDTMTNVVNVYINYLRRKMIPDTTGP
jgi:DNA-binding response OmpR family regulator